MDGYEEEVDKTLEGYKDKWFDVYYIDERLKFIKKQLVECKDDINKLKAEKASKAKVEQILMTKENYHGYKN